MKHLISAYLKEIAETTIQGDAREESYYAPLASLFEQIPLEKGKSIKVTTLPKKTDAGNPDFRVWDGKHHIVGYIEAKTPATNLDVIETSDQLQRYLDTFPNLILTDFYEFRLYRNGQEVERVSIGRPFIARKIKTTPPLENVEAFSALLERFFAFTLPKVYTAEELAIELAKRTRFLRDQVVAEELKEEEQGGGDISGFFTAFKKYLISGLTSEQFADLYSQTITYGLFAARTRANGDFNRRLAFDYIPQSIGILRDVFKFISLGNLSSQMEVIVDDIAAVLNAADINSILNQYYKEGRGEDPIVHFYETFLNQYDPQTRERRGVYDTPEPVVKYIVRSVHHLLKTRFDLRDGLADPAVTVLDPASGTLTFPVEAIKLAVNEYVGKYGEGGKQQFIREQILKNFYAFELMMAPYAIGHMKISFLLDSLGCPLGKDDRFQLYLTNTLEMEEIAQIDIPGISSLSEESRLAGRVKKQEPILVIMGNPPYSGISANKNAWTEKLLKEDLDGAQSYYKVDGKPLGERNSKWLQDDYVKFLRFAQWKIHKAGQGIVAMITNHGYLDNPTFRGMRQSLMKTFDEIYILDLHGNSLKKETAPDGSKDENVFDIRQGVAIVLLIKNNKSKETQIYHADLFGSQDEKYKWLNENDFTTCDYSKLMLTSPYYFFVQRNVENISHYLQWMKINEIFPVNSIGIVTSKDEFVIAHDKQTIINNMFQFSNLTIPTEVIVQAFNLREKSTWRINEVREKVKNIGDLNSCIKQILYRPFDNRFIFYHKDVIERMRLEVMRHMLEGGNIGLLVKRQGKREPYTYFLVTDMICESCVFESAYANNSVFPLYLYPDKTHNDLFSHLQIEKEPNISPTIFNQIESIFTHRLSPEDILNYIYAIFYSNIYRETYIEFLKIDFPRVPFTTNYDIFKQIAALGLKLIDLHLLKSSELDNPTVKYQGQGEDHIIFKPRYMPEEKRVYINDHYYFEGIEPEVWSYQIGGYQVLYKYLKDRKGRRMDDPRHYIHIATALQKTIEIQKEIDEIYPAVEKDVIQYK